MLVSEAVECIEWTAKMIYQDYTLDSTTVSEAVHKARGAGA